jgi:hypothetical protein
MQPTSRSKGQVLRVGLVSYGIGGIGVGGNGRKECIGRRESIGGKESQSLVLALAWSGLAVEEPEVDRLELSGFIGHVMSGRVRRRVSIANVYLWPHDRGDGLSMELSLLQELNHFIHCRVLHSNSSPAVMRADRREGGRERGDLHDKHVFRKVLSESQEASLSVVPGVHVQLLVIRIQRLRWERDGKSQERDKKIIGTGVCRKSEREGEGLTLMMREMPNSKFPLAQ